MDIFNFLLQVVCSRLHLLAQMMPLLLYIKRMDRLMRENGLGDRYEMLAPRECGCFAILTSFCSYLYICYRNITAKVVKPSLFGVQRKINIGFNYVSSDISYTILLAKISFGY